jgi:hypothetical protein
MQPELVEKIIKIGKSDFFNDFDLLDFLPDFPHIRGSEPIFQQELTLENSLVRQNVELLVKGLHKIELAYGLAIEEFLHRKKLKSHQLFDESFQMIDNNRFKNYPGRFGSPSPTINGLYILKRIDSKKALEIEYWIASNGGNYSVRKCKYNLNFDEWLSERRARENAIATKRNNDEKNRILKKELRKQEVERINVKHKIKVEKDRDERNSLMQMPIIELLKKIILDDIKPIHYYEDFLLSRIEEIRDTEGIEDLLNNIKDKFAIKYPKVLRKILNRIENK